MRLSANDEYVTIQNLLCGTVYQIYSTAHNEVGIGEPSSTLSTITKGTGDLTFFRVFQYVLCY